MQQFNIPDRSIEVITYYCGTIFQKEIARIQAYKLKNIQNKY